MQAHVSVTLCYISPQPIYFNVQSYWTLLAWPSVIHGSWSSIIWGKSDSRAKWCSGYCVLLMWVSRGGLWVQFHIIQISFLSPIWLCDTTSTFFFFFWVHYYASWETESHIALQECVQYCGYNASMRALTIWSSSPIARMLLICNMTIISWQARPTHARWLSCWWLSVFCWGS
jgi:hypothetical protein